jgi:hypothetical protein
MTAKGNSTQIKLDAGLRMDEGKGWIPAFAGMTGQKMPGNKS